MSLTSKTPASNKKPQPFTSIFFDFWRGFSLSVERIERYICLTGVLPVSEWFSFHWQVKHLSKKEEIPLTGILPVRSLPLPLTGKAPINHWISSTDRRKTCQWPLNERKIIHWQVKRLSSMYNVQFFFSIDKETLVKDRKFVGEPPWGSCCWQVFYLSISGFFEKSVKTWCIDR